MAISCTRPLALPGVASLVEVAHDLALPVVVGGRSFDTAEHRARQLGADGSFTEPVAAIARLDEWLDRPQRLITPIQDRPRTIERVTLWPDTSR